MGEPVTQFRLIPNDTAEVALNTKAKRIDVIGGTSVLSTGGGNEADFGTVDISSGAENSDVLTVMWNVTDVDGNTVLETFKLWLSSNDFDIEGSVIKVQPLSGADQVAEDDTENYTVDAVIGDYTWATMVEAEPEAINLWPSDEATSMGVDGIKSEDAVFWAMYAAIADGETTGTYAGTTADYELQLSFKYSYS